MRQQREEDGRTIAWLRVRLAVAEALGKATLVSDAMHVFSKKLSAGDDDDDDDADEHGHADMLPMPSVDSPGSHHVMAAALKRMLQREDGLRRDDFL